MTFPLTFSCHPTPPRGLSHTHQHAGHHRRRHSYSHADGALGHTCPGGSKVWMCVNQLAYWDGEQWEVPGRANPSRFRKSSDLAVWQKTTCNIAQATLATTRSTHDRSTHDHLIPHLLPSMQAGQGGRHRGSDLGRRGDGRDGHPLLRQDRWVMEEMEG